MKWFKHISDSLDDPFIFDLVDQFGGDGYLVFFGVLEIYAREFKPELNWNLRITRAYLKQKLHKRQDTLVMKILKHIKNSGKWYVEFNDTHVVIYIRKFTEMVDEWTNRKLRSSSVETPKILKHEVEVEVDKERDIVETPENGVPSQKIIDLYHTILPEFPRVVKLTKTRQTHLKARWHSKVVTPKGRSPDSLEFWKAYFERVRTSEFLMGNNDRGWKADFDFLITESKFISIIEGGKYR